jgi:hypothetical protein
VGGVDAYGQPKVGAPLEIRVRFNRSRREVRRPDGTSVTLDGEAWVDRLIGIDSMLWLSPPTSQQPGQALAYWTGTGQTLLDDEKMQVTSYDEIPDIKVRFVFRKIGLMKKAAGATLG